MSVNESALHLERRCNEERDALRAEVERLRSEKFATEANTNAAIMGQLSLRSDMVARWDQMRDAILHGIDGLDNDQTNSVLGCIDDFYPTDINCCEAPTDCHPDCPHQPAPVVEVTDELFDIAYRAYLDAPVYRSDYAVFGEASRRGIRAAVAALVAALGQPANGVKP